MRVTVHLAGPLAPLAGGRRRVSVESPGKTVGSALDALWAACPAVRDRVLTELGEVRPHVNVFVGAESIHFTGGLTTPVADGAEISILAAVSGGA
jgi:molybdopterin converting factor small subunit